MAYRIGLYGCGKRTQQILERALKSGVAKVTLCHDISEKNARALAEKYNAKVCSLDELLSSNEADMFLISLYPGEHPNALLKAAQTGKPIYIEKPVAVFMDDVKRLLPLKDRKDIHVGLSYRYIPIFRVLYDLVKSGKIGELAAINVNWLCDSVKPEYDPAKDLDWRYKPETGGELTQHCCHTFEWFRALAGDFHSIAAMKKVLPENKSCIEDLWDIMIRQKNGCIITFHNSYINPEFTLKGSLEGTMGTLKFEWNTPSSITYYPRKNQRSPGEEIPVPEEVTDALEEFISRMQNHKPVEVSVGDGLWSILPPIYARESVEKGTFCAFPEKLEDLFSN